MIRRMVVLNYVFECPSIEAIAAKIVDKVIRLFLDMRNVVDEQTLYARQRAPLNAPIHALGCWLDGGGGGGAESSSLSFSLSCLAPI